MIILSSSNEPNDNEPNQQEQVDIRISKNDKRIDQIEKMIEEGKLNQPPSKPDPASTSAGDSKLIQEVENLKRANQMLVDERRTEILASLPENYQKQFKDADLDLLKQLKAVAPVGDGQSQTTQQPTGAPRIPPDNQGDPEPTLEEEGHIGGYDSNKKKWVVSKRTE